MTDREALVAEYRQLTEELGALSARGEGLTLRRQDIVLELLDDGLELVDLAQLLDASAWRIMTIRDRARLRSDRDGRTG